MELALHDNKGKKTSKKVKLDDKVFGIEPNDHAIYLDVRQYSAHQRQGTSKSKERAEITGSTRKIKRQKGTGTARAGSIKNPLFRGGGTVFGPRPKDHGFKLNKKVKRLARKSALTYKAKDEQIIAMQDFQMAEPKTKEFVNILQGLEAQDKRVVFVVNEKDENLLLSTRNLQNTKVVLADSLNTYDILNCKSLVVTESSFKTIQDNLLK